MPKREDRLLLEDIYETGRKIIGFAKGMPFNEFIADVRTTGAVLINFEVIGEASGLVSNTLKERYSNIEWRKMIGLRNILIHDYK